MDPLTSLTLSPGAAALIARSRPHTFDDAVHLPAGHSRLDHRHELLVTDIRRADQRSRLIAATTSVRDELVPRLRALIGAAPIQDCAYAVFGVGAAAGQVAATAVHDGRPLPVSRVRTVIGRLPTIHLAAAPDSGPAPRGISPSARERHSRTIGALGEDGYQALRGLKVGIVGAGRTGLLLSRGLAQLGVEQISLVDPDLIEPHNLGEMEGIPPADLTRAKVEAVRDALRRNTFEDRPRIKPLPVSIDSARAVRHLKDVDVLCVCVDNPRARGVAALVGAAYLKPVLDIGTGISRNRGTRTLGGDVRLVLPDRCLYCSGGVGADPPDPHSPVPAAQPVARWFDERAGSLASLNGLLARTGQRLLEDLVIGELQTDAWVQLDTSERGVPHLVEASFPEPGDCDICRLWRGCGDELVTGGRTATRNCAQVR
jgi:molybdopterin/thiamine biosynthesis adenylyltransferase